MFSHDIFTNDKDEQIKQLTGIARLHISIARELMISEKPLSVQEMESLLELLITANEAKYLAQKLKTEVETKQSA